VIHRAGTHSDALRFGESLTQEVAYEGLLLRQRRQLHERVAALLAEEPGETTAERSAVLAHHLTRSDNRAKAVEALLAAAQAAERLPSFRTAVDFYRRAWELADTDPADERFRPAALAASAAISRLGVLYGWPGLDEAERATRRAQELAQQLGDVETQAGLLYFLGVMTILRGNFDEGLAIVENSVTMSQQAGLELTTLKLARGLAINNAFDGRFDVALRTIDWIIAELERLEPGQLSDVYVSARWIRDNVLYFQDDFDAAYASTIETLALARRVPNRTVTSGAASTLAQIQFLRGEYEEALDWADESLAVAEAIGNITGFPAPAAIALASRVELGSRPTPSAISTSSTRRSPPEARCRRASGSSAKGSWRSTTSSAPRASSIRCASTRSAPAGCATRSRAPRSASSSSGSVARPRPSAPSATRWRSPSSSARARRSRSPRSAAPSWRPPAATAARASSTPSVRSRSCRRWASAGTCRASKEYSDPSPRPGSGKSHASDEHLPALNVLRHDVGLDLADEARDVRFDLALAFRGQVHVPLHLAGRERELGEAVVRR
jgi:tetratricopeptide (TPR) repeat protein